MDRNIESRAPIRSAVKWKLTLITLKTSFVTILIIYMEIFCQSKSISDKLVSGLCKAYSKSRFSF